MNSFAKPMLSGVLSLSCALLLAGCGGGSSSITIPGSGSSTSSSGTTSSSATAVPATGLYLVGIAFPLASNNSVYVPPGTQVAGSGGVVMMLNQANTTVNVAGGSMITVPSTATGMATVLVTANSALPLTMAHTALPTVSALAGSPNAHLGAVDGTGSAARFVGGGHLAVDLSGNVQLSDGGALRQITPGGVVSTRVPASAALSWQGLATDAYSNVYGAGGAYFDAALPYGTAIEFVNTAGTVVPVRQNWTVSATNAQLGAGGLAVDSAGNLYLSDAPNNRVLKFSSGGTLQILAGGSAAGAADGSGAAATFNNPTDLSMDGSGNLYVSDTGNAAIRKITPSGTVTTLAKVLAPGAIAATSGGTVYYVGGSPRTLNQLSSSAAASIAYPQSLLADPITGLAVDSAGNVYAGTLGTGAQVFKLTF